MSWLNPFGKTKMAKDPVCGMDVDPAKTTLKAQQGGTTYYFCASACLREFTVNPSKYLGGGASGMSGSSSDQGSHEGHGGMGGGRKHGCC